MRPGSFAPEKFGVSSDPFEPPRSCIKSDIAREPLSFVMKSQPEIQSYCPDTKFYDLETRKIVDSMAIRDYE